MEEKFLTLHPQGIKGVNISLIKYNLIRGYILKVIEQENSIAFQDLVEKANRELSPTFDGKVNWYIVTVKLDLEARNLIERILGTSPHRLQICKKGLDR
jgi:hypothetical protein